MGCLVCQRLISRTRLYHDETNNIKKLRHDAQGLNVAEPAIFVLGGIVHSGTPRPLDIGPLRNAMRIHTSADEIKLKHVAKGEFLDLLKSDKLTTFLKWISDSGLVVHYHALDPLYWSLIDIIDSILYRLRDCRSRRSRIRHVRFLVHFVPGLLNTFR